jgi:hypothetical protein
VRPPRIPELADAPVVAGVAPTPSPTGEVAPPAMAIAETAKPAAKSSGGLFGSLFASKGTDAQSSEPKTDEKSAGPIDRVARLVGLHKEKSPKADTASKPKPAAHPTQVASHGAIRAKSAEPEPVKTTEAQAPAPAAAATPAPVRAQPAPTGTAMNGAAAVVPTGNFDNRWSAFR